MLVSTSIWSWFFDSTSNSSSMNASRFKGCWFDSASSHNLQIWVHRLLLSSDIPSWFPARDMPWSGWSHQLTSFVKKASDVKTWKPAWQGNPARYPEISWPRSAAFTVVISSRITPWSASLSCIRRWMTSRQYGEYSTWVVKKVNIHKLGLGNSKV